jgi:hypothetical protein
MKWLIVTMGIVMLALTYGEHLFPADSVRPLAHYVADGLHIAWLNALVLVAALIGMHRSLWRLALVGITAWGATEGIMTAACGMLDAPRVVTGQWQGLCGARAGLPLAAIGLSAFGVFVSTLWGRSE